MDEKNFGIYLNKDKRGAYCNPNAPEKLIKYVTRAGRERKQELEIGRASCRERV